ncbi:20963_t:CDS:1, partial [Gigaspora margarita]
MLHHVPTPPILGLRFILFDSSKPNIFNALMYISHQPELNIYNDSKLIVEIYSENDIENSKTKNVYDLCTIANITCPILAGIEYSAQTHFPIPNDTKIVGVSVLTGNNHYLGCE